MHRLGIDIIRSKMLQDYGTHSLRFTSYSVSYGQIGQKRLHLGKKHYTLQILQQLVALIVVQLAHDFLHGSVLAAGGCAQYGVVERVHGLVDVLSQSVERNANIGQ